MDNKINQKITQTHNRRNIEKNVKYGEYHVKHHPYATSRRIDNGIY